MSQIPSKGGAPGSMIQTRCPYYIASTKFVRKSWTEIDENGIEITYEAETTQNVPPACIRESCGAWDINRNQCSKINIGDG